MNGPTVKVTHSIKSHCNTILFCLFQHVKITRLSLGSNQNKNFFSCNWTISETACHTVISTVALRGRFVQSIIDFRPAETT